MTAPAPGPEQTPPEPPARRSSLPKTTLALAGVLVLALGFVGGIGASRLTASGNERPAAIGPSGAPRVYQSGGPAGDATVGTVERVEGDTVYVKTTDGKTVKVTTDDETNVRISKEGEVSELAKGSTVVVRGEQSGDTVSAKDIDAGGKRPVRVGPSRTP